MVGPSSAQSSSHSAGETPDVESEVKAESDIKNVNMLRGGSSVLSAGLLACGAGSLIALALACGARTSLDLPGPELLNVNTASGGFATGRPSSSSSTGRPFGTGTNATAAAVSVSSAVATSGGPSATVRVTASAVGTLSGSVASSVSARPSASFTVPTATAKPSSSISASVSVAASVSASGAPTLAMPPGNLRNCRETYATMGSACNYQLHCDQGDFQNACTLSSGGNACTCSGPGGSVLYDVQGSTNEAACREGIKLCISSAIPKPQAVTCGQFVADTKTSSACRGQLSCVESYHLTDAVTANRSKLGEVDCDLGQSGTPAHCSCTSASVQPEFSYFNYSGTNVCEVGAEVCGPAALQAIAQTAETRCGDLPATSTGAGCFASSECGAYLPAAAGSGVALVTPRTYDTYCDAVTSTGLACSCEQPDRVRMFLLQGSPDAAACTPGRAVCQGTEPVPLGGAVTCEQQQFSSSSGSASSDYACFQAFQVAGMTQQLGAYLSLNCTKESVGWSCYCSSNSQSLSMSVDAPTSVAVVNSAIATCASRANLIFRNAGQNGKSRQADFSFTAASASSSAMPSAAPSN